MVFEEGGAEEFLALGVDARGDGFDVFDCREDGELLRDGEDGRGVCFVGVVLVHYTIRLFGI